MSLMNIFWQQMNESIISIILHLFLIDLKDNAMLTGQYLKAYIYIYKISL